MLSETGPQLLRDFVAPLSGCHEPPEPQEHAGKSNPEAPNENLRGRFQSELCGRALVVHSAALSWFALVSVWIFPEFESNGRAAV